MNKQTLGFNDSSDIWGLLARIGPGFNKKTTILVTKTKK